MSHATGKGYVASHRGTYHDALARKRNVVIPMIVEVFGGISKHSRAFISGCANRAAGGKGRDATKYGTARASPRSFYLHHAQRISAACAIGNARHMIEEAKDAVKAYSSGPDSGLGWTMHGGLGGRARVRGS